MQRIPFISELIQTTEQTINYYRIQDFFHGSIKMSQFTTGVTSLIEQSLLTEEETQNILTALPQLMSAQSNQDYILLADLLEMVILPTLKNALTELIISNDLLSNINYLQDNLIALNKRIQTLSDTTESEMLKNLAASIHKCASDSVPSMSYHVELTNLGVATLKYTEHSAFYYHSNISPISEAEQLARYYAKHTQFNYCFLGFGFGYHIRALLNYDKRFQVTAIETNLQVLTLAFIFCNLTDILLNERFHLAYCKENEIPNNIKKDSDLLIHYPSLLALKNEEIKHAMNQYFIQTSSIYSQKKYLDCNFYYNTKLNDSSADELKSHFQNQSAIYIGGGPSLEYYMDYLKENMHKKIIICASTVYRHLLQQSITPDYVIMIDAQEHMMNHFTDTPPTTTSMLYLSTACHNAVKQYPGKRYILMQNGYDDAMQHANSYGYTLIETGGSVSTAAIDLLIQFGCSEIITIGLDLAYTDDKTHSFEAKLETSNNTSTKMLRVKSVVGDTIPTTNVLNLYRLWIEQRIKNVKNIKFINLSHGAYINGMDNRTY